MKILGVAALLAAIAVVLSFHPGVSINDNEAFQDTSEMTKLREEIKPALCAPYVFDYANYNKWISDARGKLTGVAVQRFDELQKSIKDQVTTGKIVSQCNVYDNLVGIRSYDGESASVLAMLEINQLSNGTPTDPTQPRMVVDLKKVDGTWKVADFSDPDESAAK